MNRPDLGRRRLAAALALAASACAAPALAQGSGARPITLTVPFPAGSATDLLARAVGEHVGRATGQAVVVENRAGANGLVGTVAAAKSPADGRHFLVATSTTHAANASLYRQLPYDPIRDFAPVSRLGEVPFVMLVNPALPADTLDRFVAHVRANPGKYAWGSGSSGSLVPGHALVASQRLDMTHAPYKGVQPAMNDAIGGQIQLVFADVASAAPQVKAGRLRALAVTSAAEHPMLPGVPPLSRAVPGFEMTAWFALYAPAGTPEAEIQKMNRWVREAMADAGVQSKLGQAGVRLTPSSPAELGLFAAKESVKWAKAVASAQIEPQ